jgi:hypothetical protein
MRIRNPLSVNSRVSTKSNYNSITRSKSAPLVVQASEGCEPYLVIRDDLSLPSGSSTHFGCLSEWEMKVVPEEWGWRSALDSEIQAAVGPASRIKNEPEA